MRWSFSQAFEYILPGGSKNKESFGRLRYWFLSGLFVYILAPTFTKLIFNRGEMFSSSSKRKDKYVTGLINNRNDCFANSSVQALAALPKLTQYLNEMLRNVSLIANMLDNENQDKKADQEDTVLHGDLVEGHVVNPVNRWDDNFLTPKVELKHNPIDNSFGMDYDLVTPKAELEENPMENLSCLDGMVENAELPRNKSTSTLSTLRNGSKVSNHGAHSTAAVSENQEFDTKEETAVTSAEIPEMLMHLGLARILAQLQETITTSKSISVWPLLRILEIIFNAKISTGQNDAHELTQIILETLQKENSKLNSFIEQHKLAIQIPVLPFKGKIVDHLVCLKCGESSKINIHPFNIFPLHVPQAFSAKLSDMVADNQTETIEGYSCLVCKVKAILANEKSCNRKGCSSEECNILETLERVLSDLFINDDISEELLSYIDTYDKNGVVTKDIKSTIVKKTAVVDSADVLVLHLSRSMFDGMSYTRNSCGVAFDEVLECVEQVIENNRCVGIKTVKYKLKAMVKHTGSHSQGHYECYRHKPDLVKDTLSKEVINRSVLIDSKLLNINNPKVNESFKGQDPPVLSNGATESFTQQINNSQSNFTLNRDAIAAPVKSNTSSEDDYVISTGTDSNKPSRKPSALQKISGFLSRRSSISTNVDDTTSETGSPNPVDMSRKSSTNISVNRSRSGSVITNGDGRSRAGSVTNSINNGRQRGSSISSVDSRSSYINSSDTNFGSTSASDVDNNNSDNKRIYKKIKSVSKYPFWHISDTKVKEAKVSEVLAEMRYVYMLYYELVD